MGLWQHCRCSAPQGRQRPELPAPCKCRAPQARRLNVTARLLHSRGWKQLAVGSCASLLICTPGNSEAGWQCSMSIEGEGNQSTSEERGGLVTSVGPAAERCPGSAAGRTQRALHRCTPGA